MILRDYDPADFAALYEIEQAVFSADIAYSRGDLRRFLRARRCRTVVAEDGSEVVGFVTGCREGKGVGRVASLDVAPERQGEGIGSRLLAAIEEWLWEQGAQVLRLETPADEAAGARRFYERHGYAVEEAVEDYYGEGLDALRMAKRPASPPGMLR